MRGDDMYPNLNPNFLTKSFQFIKSVKWGALLDGTGKTLGVINQAIPIIYQVKPLFSNAKTLMKIVNGFNDNVASTTVDTTSSSESKNSPVFYI